MALLGMHCQKGRLLLTFVMSHSVINRRREREVNARHGALGLGPHSLTDLSCLPHYFVPFVSLTLEHVSHHTFALVL